MLLPDCFGKVEINEEIYVAIDSGASFDSRATCRCGCRESMSVVEPFSLSVCFGADAFSFGEGIALKDGDVMVVEWKGFGRALRNPIRIDKGREKYIKVTDITLLLHETSFI
jgi:hypothetical protein